MSNIATLQVKWIRIIPYAYWPPGVYYWDNVKVVKEPVKEPTTRSAAKAEQKPRSRVTPQSAVPENVRSIVLDPS